MKKSMKTESLNTRLLTSSREAAGAGSTLAVQATFFTLTDAKYTLSTAELARGNRGRHLLAAPGDIPGTARTWENAVFQVKLQSGLR